MEPTATTREEMWAKQQLNAIDIDYSIWDQNKETLLKSAHLNRSCIFAVDVYKCRYDFASSNFCNLLGYDKNKIDTLYRQGDYLESRFHPDDREQLVAIQVKLSSFIYSLPPENRNDYQNIYQFRVLNARGQYVNMISRQQVIQKDKNGKAWIVLGIMDISPDQLRMDTVKCSVLNLKTGQLTSPALSSSPKLSLTQRETEILQLIKQGLFSKEIADRLCISIHTVNIHRQHILRKTGVNSSIEAINSAEKDGIFNELM